MKTFQFFLLSPSLPGDREETIMKWEAMHETWPQKKHTDNNKLQLAAR